MHQLFLLLALASFAWTPSAAGGQEAVNGRDGRQPGVISAGPPGTVVELRIQKFRPMKSPSTMCSACGRTTWVSNMYVSTV